MELQIEGSPNRGRKVRDVLSDYHYVVFYEKQKRSLGARLHFFADACVTAHIHAHTHAGLRPSAFFSKRSQAVAPLDPPSPGGFPRSPSRRTLLPPVDEPHRPSRQGVACSSLSFLFSVFHMFSPPPSRSTCSLKLPLAEAPARFPSKPLGSLRASSGLRVAPGCGFKLR